MSMRITWKKKQGGAQQEFRAEADDEDKSNAIISDIIMNYKTVISFGQKNIDQVIDKYDRLRVEQLERNLKNWNIAGASNGWACAGRVTFVGLSFILGNVITVRMLEVEWYKVIGATFILFFSLMSIGMQAQNIPSISKAREAAKVIFNIIDEPSALDIDTRNEDTVDEVVSGMIQFKEVSFKYPTRDQMVLDQMNLKIPAGAKIALVGHSGCGKSTITNLLLRFYDVNGGQIKIDGVDLNDYNPLSLRTQIGYVMQEPILFNTTIKKNILYGELDANDEEVYKAALKANAVGFIEGTATDMKPEEEEKDVENKFEKKFEELAITYSKLQRLNEGLQNFSLAQKKLILEILSNGDEKILDLINENHEAFLALVET